MSKLKDKMGQLPKSAGVYMFKDAGGHIIYIGKAAVLRNRVRQYFHASRVRDAKTDILVSEIKDVDWIEVETELDALFLEAELVRRYMPQYNILLRDDKSTAYVRITYKSLHPTVTITRRPLDDGAEYFGPYFNATAVRRALGLLRKVFPYSTHVRNIPKRSCLQYHLGLCPGLEEDKTTLSDYRANLKKLIRYLKGERSALMRSIEKDMKTAAKSADFELAATLRNQLFALKGLTRQIVFSDKEFLDISKDMGLSELAQLLGLSTPPHRVEGYDISHMSGTDTAASMIVFINGLPFKTAYRKFKMKLPGNDDFAHMNEVIKRRLSDKHLNEWGKPDMILIDGGKGQLSAALKARDTSALPSVPMIGLAKREEEIIIAKADFATRLQKPSGFVQESPDFYNVLLPKTSHAIKLLQRIRDESHRFAVSYHSVLKAKRQTSSLLDDIPGVGPTTRKKLMNKFGSYKGIVQADVHQLAEAIGQAKAQVVWQYVNQRAAK